MAGCHNDIKLGTDFFAKVTPQGQQKLKQFSTPGQEPKCVTLPCLPERRLCQISKTEPCTKSRKSIDEWLTEIFVTILQTQKIT